MFACFDEIYKGHVSFKSTYMQNKNVCMYTTRVVFTKLKTFLARKTPFFMLIDQTFGFLRFWKVGALFVSFYAFLLIY